MIFIYLNIAIFIYENGDLINKKQVLIKMPEKCKSFFDWELSFRSKKRIGENHLEERVEKRTNLNSLGIDKKEWSDFMESWKRENLP